MDKVRIMIVDDDQDMREVLAIWARNQGYTPLTATNGQDALQQIQESDKPIQVIFSDVAMPHMDGLELLDSLNKIGWHNPFIIQTGVGDKAMSIRALQLGAFDFLEKPISSSDFLRILETASQTAKRRHDVIEMLVGDYRHKYGKEMNPQELRALINLHTLKKRTG
jgi:DNA-binding NtrC family response regulator